MCQSPHTWKNRPPQARGPEDNLDIIIDRRIDKPLLSPHKLHQGLPIHTQIPACYDVDPVHHANSS